MKKKRLVELPRHSQKNAAAGLLQLICYINRVEAPVSIPWVKVEEPAFHSLDLPATGLKFAWKI